MSDETATATSKGGLFEDLVEVLWAPAAVFERSRNRSAWGYIGVLTLVLVVLLVATRSLLQPYFDANYDLQIIKAAEQGQTVPAEAVAAGRTVAGYILLFTFALTAIGSGLLGGFVNWATAKMFGAGLSFGGAMLVAALACVPRVLSLVSMAVQGAVLDTSNLRSMFDASLGVARFLDPTTASPVVLTLAASVDLFAIWNLFITAVGVSVIARQSRGTGWLVAIVGLALTLLFSIVPAALS